MMPRYLAALLLPLVLSSCATDSNQGTIAELDTVSVELKDVDVEGGLDRAMEGYQKFLEQTPESELTPEAIRRLADLKVEKEYGIATSDEVMEAGDDAGKSTGGSSASVTSLSSPAPGISTHPVSGIEAPGAKASTAGKNALAAAVAADKESEKDFENRATQQQQIQPTDKKGNLQLPKGEAGADLQNAGAEEAISLYKKLLKKYPMYERNDQVLYQLTRAYEETGQVDEAMEVMNRLVKQFPDSRYNDEVQFRRGEYYFTRKKYLDAEDAYGEVLKYGVGTVYYERALYKKGWTFYKQELYEEALHQFFTLLDYKVSIGFNFEKIESKIEKKRIDDTFRVVSLSFSNLGGAETVHDYFSKNGSRAYEHNVYRNLAEFYFDKRRYSDAAKTYNTFIDANPFHEKSPHFSMRVIEIFKKGHFPRLVIEAKKQFASTYGIHAEYWNYFNQAEYPKVLGYLKTNITDLANHYHSLYQNKKFIKDKPNNFTEASHWYREFLKSFPRDEQSPKINYQLADLFLENKNYKQAAVEYEHSAYDYPVNEKSSKAAYAAVYAYREHLKTAPASQVKDVKREIIRTSIRLVDTFPQHPKATIVLGAAVDDLFEMRDFTLAIKLGRRLIGEYPGADAKIRRGAWLVVAHSSFEIEKFHDAELAYIEVLNLTAKSSKERKGLVENLAASVYKQGEQARANEDYKTAVRHFLRIADLAPTSKIRPTAEYDAAAVLIQIMDLERAAKVLLAFRENYPRHKLQHDVTKKIAYVYKEMGKYSLAAKEFERVAAEAKDEDLIRESMLTAAELYSKAKDTDNSLRVYKQFVVKFPKPLEFALETYYKIAMIHKSRDDLQNYRKTLQHIIKADANAGNERTDRTRYLAAQSSLVIIEPRFDDFIAIKLVKPFKVSLTRKQKTMKSLVASYSKLVDYKVADVTAASTFYIAEIYYNFSRSLLSSEKPDGLSDLELEEFNLMLEDQAFPFEEKAIKVHEKNVELLSVGVYSNWIDRSIEKLAKLLPARYDKPEESTDYIAKVDNYIYSSPRFVREDATTGYLTNIGFFRYVSQNQQHNHHKSNANADITTQEDKGSTEPAGTPAQAESASSTEVEPAPATGGAVGSTRDDAPSADTVTNVTAAQPEVSEAQEAQSAAAKDEQAIGGQGDQGAVSQTGESTTGDKASAATAPQTDQPAEVSDKPGLASETVEVAPGASQNTTPGPVANPPRTERPAEVTVDPDLEQGTAKDGSAEDQASPALEVTTSQTEQAEQVSAKPDSAGESAKDGSGETQVTPAAEQETTTGASEQSSAQKSVAASNSGKVSEKEQVKSDSGLTQAGSSDTQDAVESPAVEASDTP
ncbi:MAG: tetratricopeptide repeat protein [Gammaproteobacteria bacterium]|jgi:tetratricopeptide (TPR) repeat protein